MKRLIFIIVLSSVVLYPYKGIADPSIPESLFYSLYWIGIKAGTASLEVTETQDGIKITSRANSAKWVSIFYKVEDIAYSVLGSDGYPRLYRIKIREGRHRRDKEVAFYTDQGRILYNDRLNNEQLEFALKRQVFDPLSGFYEIRRRELEVGRSEYVEIFDSKRFWNVEVQVLRRERVSTPAGEFDTIVVKPLLQSEGIFIRKGDILVWLTDDNRKIPVMVRSKVKIGSVTAKLTGGEY